MENKIKVIVVDDHELFRNGIAMVINKLKYAEIVAEASNGIELINILEKQKADVIFMDIKMPEMNGIEATLLALKKDPSLKIIALSMFGEEEYLQNMIDAGAKGFLTKNIKKNELDIALRLIADGKNYYSEELLQFFTNKFIKKETVESGPDLHNLTQRELEVLKLVAEGYSNQEIADKLFISQRTVDGHKANLISKTGSKNIVHLLVYAIKNKLLEI
jgi:DNA-binding NarL/FixJ family response regulator